MAAWRWPRTRGSIISIPSAPTKHSASKWSTAASITENTCKARYNGCMHLPTRGTFLAASALVGAALLIAQPDWKTVTNLPAVDFSGLSQVQSRALLRLLRNHDCTCGCGMKVAEC